MPDSPEGNALPALPRFYSALLQVANAERKDHVRIAWLGDSHTQPDIWTRAVRRPLQERFGGGGPGFVHVGWKKWGYGHANVALEVEGRWRIQPPRLLTVEPYEDGVLGLGGVRLVPHPGARASIRVDDSELPAGARWELAFRITEPGGLMIVRPSGGAAIELRHDEADLGVRHVAWESSGPGGRFETELVRGKVELFGVVVESSEGTGLVMDVLGLNGARVVHTLTWDERAWTTAMARRHPDLAVLAYGSNEAGIPNLSMEEHREQMVALLDRIRKASPQSDCLVVGVMDRGGVAMSEKVERIGEAQSLAARDRGCAFWSAQKAMGGRNSMQAWVAKEPPLAASDRVHLKVAGYKQLGALLARDLLQAFDSGR